MSSSEWNSAYTGGGQDPADADALMIETVGQLPPARALDLGCGAGGNAIALAESGWEVMGVDFASRAVDSARKHAEDRGVDVAFEVADATKWKAPHEFDLVISNFALPPAELRGQLLEQAVGALAPGGTLVVQEWDRSMADAFHGHVEPDDLVTVDELVSALGELEIELATTKVVPAHEHGDHSHGHECEHGHHEANDDVSEERDWTAVLIRARRPAGS